MVAEPVVEKRHGRVPPQDVEAERSVLGAMLLEPAAVSDISARLVPEDFYRPAHAVVFEAMLALYGRNEPIDEVTVRAQLHAEGRLDQVGGAAFVASLTESVPTAANVGYYARIVKGRALSRRLIAAATSIAGAVYEKSDDIDLLLDTA